MDLREQLERLIKKVNQISCQIASGLGSSIIVTPITTNSPTYTNASLIGADPVNIYVEFGGDRIYPTFNSTTGTLDYSNGGGFSNGGVLSVIYQKNGTGSGGSSGSSPVVSQDTTVWVTKNTSDTLAAISHGAVVETMTGNVILTLPTPTKNINIKVIRIDNSVNTLKVVGNINKIVAREINFLTEESYTFSWDNDLLTYLLN